MEKRAIVYLDGYNFYYGLLRKGPYKWLDLVPLFEDILHIQNPDISLVKLNYFTSPAQARYARHGQESVIAQNSYHRALKQRFNKKRFEIVPGYHEITAAHMPKAPKGVSKINKDETERVWRVVEKKTDVQLAIGMYADAASSKCDVIVLCTNDSDIEPALMRIRQDFPKIEIGFIAAVPPPVHGTPEGRRPNKSLEAQAHWTRHFITEEELKDHQLPPEVNTGNGSVSKPKHW